MQGDLAVRSSNGELPATAARPLALSELAAERTEKLPREYPRAPQDTIGLSARARELITNRTTPAIEVATFWDHPARNVSVGSRRLALDASASYKLE